MTKSSKMTKLSLITSFCLVIIILALWAIQFAKINHQKFDTKVEIYEMGETVEIGENFFGDARENSNGYSVRVNKVELVEYKSFLEQNGGSLESGDFTEAFPAPKYTYLVEVTIENVANEEGAIMILNYALYHKALKLPIDFELWGLMDERFTGEAGFRLRENTEVTLTIPFTPMSLDTGNNSAELEKRMLNDEFYFCICEFPTRKMIRIIPNE